MGARESSRFDACMRKTLHGGNPSGVQYLGRLHTCAEPSVNQYRSNSQSIYTGLSKVRASINQYAQV